MRAAWLLGTAVLVAALVVSAQPPDTGWPMHGGALNIRYSPLTPIDRKRLAPGAGLFHARVPDTLWRPCRFVTGSGSRLRSHVRCALPATFSLSSA
jgi:hypothetical protein